MGQVNGQLNERWIRTNPLQGAQLGEADDEPGNESHPFSIGKLLARSQVLNAGNVITIQVFTRTDWSFFNDFTMPKHTPIVNVKCFLSDSFSQFSKKEILLRVTS